MFENFGKLFDAAKKVADNTKTEDGSINLYKSSYHKRNKFKRFLEMLGAAVLWTAIFGGIIALFAGLFLFGSWLLMIAWNCVATYFGWKVITYPVAIAIAWLLSVIQSTIGGNRTADSK